MNNNIFRVIVAIVIGCTSLQYADTIVRVLMKLVGNESNVERGYTVFKHCADGTANSVTEESVKTITEHDQEEGHVSKNHEKLQHYPNTVANGTIYWSDEVEKLIPKGLSEDVADEWVVSTRSSRIKVECLEAASTDKCGHSSWAQQHQPNAFAVLTDGSKMCVRSRMGQPEFLVAESLSYWLARFLTLDNVPPVTLTYSNHATWSVVKGVMQSLKWKNDSLLSLCLWVDGIGQSNDTAKWRRVPTLIRNAWGSGLPVTKDTFKEVVLGDQNNSKSTRTVQPRTMTVHEEMALMAQWSTMIVFDFITGNADRLHPLFLNQNVYKRTVAHEVINNLAVFKTSPKLWLIDNETGFRMINETEWKEKIVQTCCIFQRKVVERLVSLDKEPSPWETFLKFVLQHEPILQTVRKEQWKKILSKEVFSARVGRLVRWFEQCEKGLHANIASRSR